MSSQKNFNALIEENFLKIDDLARNVDIISLEIDSLKIRFIPPKHVAQSWERMKLMIRNCPTHGLNLWMIIQKIYARLNFASRNLLDLAAGGTFMEIT